MGRVKKLLVAMCVSMVMVLIVPIAIPNSSSSVTVEAATKVKLNKKKATLYVGKTLKLKVKGTSEKVEWSSNKKSVATVSAKGKVKATITATVGGKSTNVRLR